MTVDYDKIWSDIEENQIESMTVSEFRNYILAFLFYRYLSEIQENYLIKEQVIDIEDGQTINDIYGEVAVGTDLADYLNDISANLGYALEPNDTWASLVYRISDSSIVPSDYQKIFEHFNKNAQLNKEAVKNFQGIFDDINLGDSRLGSDANKRARSLNKIVKLVDGFNYGDYAGKLFGELIERFAGSAGKTGGQFYTPYSVSELLAKIVTAGIEKSDNVFSVYDPACGSGSTLLSLQNQVPGGTRKGAIKYYGQEKELTTYNLSRMNLSMNDISYKNIILNNADSLALDWSAGPNSQGIDQMRVFDAVVSDIEFATSWDNSASRKKEPRFKGYEKLAPKGTADYAFILHSLYHLNDEGTMAMVLPHGVLFRGGVPGQKGAGAEAFIRKNLINHPSGNKIYAVIGLPENIMFSEKGKKSVAVAIVVFKKKRDTDDILFIDASNNFDKGKNKNFLSSKHIDEIIQAYTNRSAVSKYAHLVAKDEIILNEYNLNIPRYVFNVEEEAEIDLEAINQLLDKDDEEIAEVKAKVDETLRVLGVRQ